jgi:hypothetical protein
MKMKKSLVILILVLAAGPLLAQVNYLHETFNGAFDLPWTVYYGTFSPTTFDVNFIGKAGNGGCFLNDDPNRISGGAGSWRQECAFKNIYANVIQGIPGGWIEYKNFIWFHDSNEQIVGLVFFMLCQSGQSGVNVNYVLGFIQDFTTGQWIKQTQIPLPDGPLPTTFHTYVDKIDGPEGVQFVLRYDIGNGRQFLLTVRASDFDPLSTFLEKVQLPTTHLFVELPQWNGQIDDKGFVSIDDWFISPIPRPINGSQVTNPTELRWMLPYAACVVDDDNAVTCNVWFGTEPNMSGATKIVNNQSIESTSNFSVVPNKWYYWRVDTRDPNSCGASPEVIQGPVWSFYSLPSIALNPSPANNSNGVPVTLNKLTWTPAPGNTFQKLYFGTAATPPFVANLAVDANSFTISGLHTFTNYYWRIDSSFGSGELWKFETGDKLCYPPLQGDLNGDCKVDLYDFTIFADNWLKCNWVPTDSCL